MNQPSLFFVWLFMFVTGILSRRALSYVSAWYDSKPVPSWTEALVFALSFSIGGITALSVFGR